MEMLTRKVSDVYVSTEIDYAELLDIPDDNWKKIDKTIQKLGKLEDLEKQIGMPLEVLFSLLNDTLYVIDTNYKKPFIKDLRVESINKICRDYYFVCSENLSNNDELDWITIKQKDILYFFIYEEAEKKLEEMKNESIPM